MPSQGHFNVETTLFQRQASTLNQRWNKVAYESWGNVENVTLFQRQNSTLIQRRNCVEIWFKIYRYDNEKKVKIKWFL